MRRSAKGRLCLALFLVSFLAPASTLRSQQRPLGGDDLRVLQGSPFDARYSEMLFHYLAGMAGKEEEASLARLRAIRSEVDFKDWQEATRQKFLQLIGGLPDDRAPLNAHVLGEFKRPDYLVRKVVFESLPEYYVTSNLYVPRVGRPPFPAVLCPLGHSRNGKAYPEYQRLFIGFAKRGYVVLAYDAPGQGERIQFWNYLSNERQYQFRSNDHGLYGVQEYLLGQNLARYLIWDGIRGLDYLSSLPEVDSSRIGVTGNSGGGALTTYISMSDPRDAMDADFTYASFFLGRPLLGMRVWDALSAIAYTRTRADVDPQHITLVGRGWAGVVGAYAGALDRGVTGVAVESVPASYEEIARCEEYTQPVSLMLPGVLEDFDLTDVYAAVAPRPLLILNPTNATTGRMTHDEALVAMKMVISTYRAYQSSSAFEVGSTPYEPDIAKNLVAWIIRH